MFLPLGAVFVGALRLSVGANRARGSSEARTFPRPGVGSSREGR